MSVSSATSRNDYVGNDSTAVYAYSFYIFDDTDLVVTVRNISTGTETTLVLNTDYTVSGVGLAAGGNVTLVNSSQAWLDASGYLTSAYTLTIQRVRPLTQLTDIRNQGDYYPEVIEDSFDNACMVDQQLNDSITGAIRLPASIAPGAFDTTLPASILTSPNVPLIVNASGNGISVGTATDITRFFNADSLANLIATAAAAPTLQRFGWATDFKMLLFYTADLTVKVIANADGWVPLGGAQ